MRSVPIVPAPFRCLAAITRSGDLLQNVLGTEIRDKQSCATPELPIPTKSTGRPVELRGFDAAVFTASRALAIGSS